MVYTLMKRCLNADGKYDHLKVLCYTLLRIVKQCLRVWLNFGRHVYLKYYTYL